MRLPLFAGPLSLFANNSRASINVKCESAETAPDFPTAGAAEFQFISLTIAVCFFLFMYCFSFQRYLPKAGLDAEIR
jgi:hypothetical protein